MARIRLVITYEGTRYSGWQRQINTAHTVQEILETHLAKVVNHRVSLMPCGRTDAGVHARIQVVHGDIPDTALRHLEPGSPIAGEPKLKHALNCMLPNDIRILTVERVRPDFHAIRDVHRKTYLYFIDTSPVQWPELRRYSWHLRLPMNWQAIEQATQALTGRHDFKAFCGKGSSAKTTVRTIHEAWWGSHGVNGFASSRELKVFRVTGSGFLKHMVRSLVGTLVHIGNGKAPPEKMAELLQSGVRRHIGPTAPPQGLWLWDVSYKR